jgi:hypothetical protein
MDYKYTVKYIDHSDLKILKNVLDKVFLLDSLSEKKLANKHLSSNPSIVVFVFKKNECVAVRCIMICNPTNENKFYQHCETAVLENHRSKGIFTKMTTIAIDFVKQHDKSAKFINFPNNQSVGGYKKLGYLSSHIYKGFVTFKIFSPSLFRINFKNLFIEYEGRKIIVKKSNLFARTFEVLDYHRKEDLMRLSLFLFLKGYLLINISIENTGFIFSKKNNIVYDNKHDIIENFRPYWIDTVKFS